MCFVICFLILKVNLARLDSDSLRKYCMHFKLVGAMNSNLDEFSLIIEIKLHLFNSRGCSVVNCREASMLIQLGNKCLIVCSSISCHRSNLSLRLMQIHTKRVIMFTLFCVNLTSFLWYSHHWMRYMWSQNSSPLLRDWKLMTQRLSNSECSQHCIITYIF